MTVPATPIMKCIFMVKYVFVPLLCTRFSANDENDEQRAKVMMRNRKVCSI